MKRLALFAVAGAVLLTVAFSYLLYGPRVDEQRALETETAELQTRQAGLRADVRRLEQLQLNAPVIAASLERHGRLVPAGPDQSETLSQFQGAADTAGVKIASVNFAPPVPATPVVPLGIDRQLGVIATTMVLQGPYQQTVDFLRHLETQTPRAELLQTVSVAEGEGGYPTLSTTWTGHLFTILPMAVAEPVAQTPATPEAAAQTASTQP